MAHAPWTHVGNTCARAMGDIMEIGVNGWMLGETRVWIRACVYMGARVWWVKMERETGVRVRQRI